jgi:cell division protein FtsZ
MVNQSVGKAIIKVIGVGDAGCNAVERMIQDGVRGVEYVCANTDSESLRRSSAANKIQFGPGRGAGGRPEKARDLAMDQRKRIAELLQGAQMVIVVACMGGCTDTCASPVVAELARKMGILTVAVVTVPFEFDGGRRLDVGWRGLSELNQHVDALLVIPDVSTIEELGADFSLIEALSCNAMWMRNTVGAIVKINNTPGLIELDFADVRSVAIGMVESRANEIQDPASLHQAKGVNPQFSWRFFAAPLITKFELPRMHQRD